MYLTRKPKFDPGGVLVGFVVDKVALGKFFLPVLLFHPVSIFPPMPHTRLHLHVALTRGINGRSLGTFLNSNVVLEIGKDLIENTYTFFGFLMGF